MSLLFNGHAYFPLYLNFMQLNFSEISNLCFLGEDFDIQQLVLWGDLLELSYQHPPRWEYSGHGNAYQVNTKRAQIEFNFQGLLALKNYSVFLGDHPAYHSLSVNVFNQEYRYISTSSMSKLSSLVYLSTLLSIHWCPLNKYPMNHVQDYVVNCGVFQLL